MLLFYLSLIIFTGLVFGKIAKLLRLPNVTGYIIGGLIVGPVLGLFGVEVFPKEVLEEVGIISQIALGFIAFSIGTEFKISYFKRVGKLPIVIAILESFLAIIAVLVVLLIMGVDPQFALVLSSIAAATAPAATIMVIKQYKAKGEVTENLLSVVALDDATAIIFFGLFVAIARVFDAEAINVYTFIKPFLEILASFGLGLIAGIIITLLLRWYTGRGNRTNVVIAMILLVSSITVIVKNVIPDFEISALLSCMMMGAIFTNTAKSETIDTVMGLVDRVTPPIFLMFFVISGISLDLQVLTTVGIVGVVYIVMRVVGKVSGAYLGATICKAPTNVRKYLGFGLIPQAGVAIGLTIVADSVVPQYAPQIKAVILSATLIYELVGPLITRASLKAAGEIVIAK